MMRRSSSWPLLALAGCALLGGCHIRTSTTAPSTTAAATRPPSPATDSDPVKIEAHAHYAAGVVLAMEADSSAALDEFYAAVSKDPKNVQLALEVSQEFVQAGQLQKALTILEGATRQPAPPGELFSRLGELDFQLNHLDAAKDACLAAIKADPNLTGPYAVLVQIDVQKGQPQEALSLLDRATKLPHAPPELLVLCGRLYLQLNSQLPSQTPPLNDRALAAFKRVDLSESAEPELKFRLAEGFGAVGQYDAAATLYTQLFKDFSDRPAAREDVRSKLAEILPKLADRGRAADLLQLMIQDNPTDSRAYFLLGGIFYELTNLVQAAECYSKTILLSPDFEPAYGALASAQLGLNQVPAAEATLENGRQKFPRSFVLEYLSGLTAFQLKDYTNAVKRFTAAEVIALATDPKRLQETFYFQFGSACERLGDLAQAETNFVKCLAIAPNFDEAQNYLGYMWAEHGLNLERARDLITKALKAEPKNPAYLDSMAWVLFKLNQPGSALDFELKAMANGTEQDAETCDHLGDIYQALGEREKARDSWSKSMKIDPKEAVRKKLEAEPK